jgi:hypothetical protein
VPDRPDMIMQAANIARILAETDVSHLWAPSRPTPSGFRSRLIRSLPRGLRIDLPGCALLLAGASRRPTTSTSIPASAPGSGWRCSSTTRTPSRSRPLRPRRLRKVNALQIEPSSVSLTPVQLS